MGMGICVVLKIVTIIISIIIFLSVGILLTEVLLNYYSVGGWMWYFGTLREDALLILILKFSLLVAIWWD